MTQQIIGVGAAPNDHTGDPIRVCFQKCNTNFDQLFQGPSVIGPPTSGITLTVNQGNLESNSTPGIWVTGSVGFQAAIALGANGTSPGVGSFDFQQAANGNGFIVVRPAASLNFWTNNTPRLSINSTGNCTIQAPTADVNGLIINGNNVSGVTGALKAISTSTARIATFDCTQGTGGYIAIERSAADGGFFGNSAILVNGGTLDDYAIRSNASLDFATGGNTKRGSISTNGNMTLFTPGSGINLVVDQGALANNVTPGIQVKGNSTFGARISLCGNGSSPNINSFDILQDGTGDIYIVNRSNHNMAFWTNNTPTMLLSSAQQAFFYGNLAVWGNTPPAQVTGWGTPVGSAVINNYNITDAGGANSNTNKAVAQIIKDLKALGFYGA